MATNKAPAIKVPAKLPSIPGMTPKQVANLYRAERLGPGGDGNGLGHVRVMARLNRRARGEDVTPVAQLRRYTEPVQPKASASA